MLNLLAKRIKRIRAGKPMIKQLPMYLLLLLCGLFLFTSDGRAGEVGQKFIPGMYEGLMLAVDHEEVVGFFNVERGEGVTFRCSFFLRGKEVKGQANIVTWSGRRIRKDGDIYFFPGLLKNENKDDINLKIEQGSGEHPGCSMAIGPQVGEEGLPLSRNYEAKWLSLRMVKNDRASLFSGPAHDKKTKSYFIRGDVLGVLSVNGEWLNIEFPRPGKKPIKGWVRSDDVEDLQPPQKK